MIKKILAASALLASFTAGAANCNLENIKGNWIWYLPGSDFTQQINQQCSVYISVARGNSPYATVTGLCTDLVSGYVGTVLPGSTVTFVNKSCNLVGTFITGEAPPADVIAPSRNGDNLYQCTGLDQQEVTFRGMEHQSLHQSHPDKSCRCRLH